MKVILRYCLLATALTGGATLSPGQTPSRSAGKVLVLDNGRALEGDIERHGDQYRICRARGEVWLPIEPGMRLCADWKEAHAFMASQANLLDPDERVRLARWCHLNGLREQALAELTAALQLQPNNGEAKQMRAVLERSLVMEKAAEPAAAPGERPAGEKLPAVNISSDAIAMFTSRVQPILMNACVSCHSGNKSGSFQLYRTYHGGQRLATLKNVAAVLPLIHAENPELSPFLIKAVSPHDPTGQAPLKKRSVPFYTLQTWVLQLIASNPQLHTERPAPAKTRAAQQAVTTKPAQVRLHEVVKTGTVTASAPAVQPPPARPEPTTELPAANTATAKRPVTAFAVPDAPNPEPASRGNSAARESQTPFAERTQVAPAEPTDPFDPAIFNQLPH